MTVSTKEEKQEKKIGRPKLSINWDKVDFLLEAGCSGAQVAHNLGFDPNTLYARCVEDKGMSFTDYSAQKWSKGEAELTACQYLKATGKSDLGDNTLLIWLGKTRLKQKEYQDEQIKAEVESAYLKLMNQMEKDKQNTSQPNDNRPTSTETA